MRNSLRSGCEVGKLTTDEHARLTRAVDTLEKAEIYIDDTPGLEAVELRSRARRLKKRYGIGLIVIDYLQLMNYEVCSGWTSA